ncbi:FAD-dependent oxidoreductase [Murimonas intestini]|uniref:FAD-dependent oxidoreductase n=1 Tax=Murimonas intestini TaxID=1337051 RepID=UPI0011DC94C7|nr:FAD-dependent oxidoreductase [Murimonas intestini]
MAKKTVIIGGVAGGATAAARLRRRDEKMEIVVLERGEYISFANCGLPYYIGDVIKSREALLLQTPEAMKKKFDIQVRTGNEVTALHPEKNTITVKDIKTGKIYEEGYDNLILATGSSPVKPPIPGIEAENIFTLWNIPDTDRIKKFLTEKRPKSAAVIGGGFIGLEMAENLHRAGLSVSVIEMQDQVMAPLDKEMAQLLHENMQENGVQLLLGDGVEKFSGDGEKTTIFLKSGKCVDADMIILSIGVRPNSQLAREAGLEVNPRGGVVVNAHLQTSVPNIYAVGDVTETTHLVTGEKTMIPLAGPANKQARICADNIAGDSKTYGGTIGTAVARVFDMSAATAGLNEKMLIEAGKIKGTDYEAVIINQKSHAGYYPGATPLTLKLIFEKDGKILGAQIVGQEGADKRIDMIATVMRLGGNAEDLAKLELSYAPPYSSAKDPVNMLGFVAENIRKGLVSFISVKELDELMAEPDKKDSFLILDITEDVERMVFSIPGSIHIPLGQLRERIRELDTDKLIIPYCAVGVRSYNAARILMQNGFSNVKVLEGGTSLYKTCHYTPSATEAEREGQERNEMRCAQEENIIMGEKQRPAVNEMKMQILDCCGMQCPGPIMKVNETLKTMKDGECLEISATDMGFARDIEAWCARTGNTMLGKRREGVQNIVRIQKGWFPDVQTAQADGGHDITTPGEDRQGKTIIVFDGDLDKVLAAFIIANGAAAMGRPVTMFFTFWGLNALRKTEKVKVKKPFMEKMFGAMMPRGTGKLKLSNMNMGGMGTKMMKKVMKDKNVSSLEELMKQAMAQGIKLVACTMSMDVMGITKEELIDGVELAGVASYLGDAEMSNVNLFV